MTEYATPRLTEEQNAAFQDLVHSPDGKALMSGLFDDKPAAIVVGISLDEENETYVVAPIAILCTDNEDLLSRLRDPEGRKLPKWADL